MGHYYVGQRHWQSSKLLITLEAEDLQDWSQAQEVKGVEWWQWSDKGATTQPP